MQSPFTVGALVDARYRIVRRIGEGGMGAVFEARREGLDQRVALKALHGGRPTPTQRARFEREAKVVSHLTHPHTVRLFDFGVHADAHPYLVFEYLAGESLEVLKAAGPMAPTRVLRIASQICGALAEAHEHGVIHRDLKPANVMLTQVEGSDFARLVDFGIASVDAETLTQSGTVVGTALYMSPEQICGDAVGPGSDLYALGVMLFELLRGEHPYRFTNRSECMAAHVHQAPQPLDPPDAPGRFSAALSSLIAALLSKDPAVRPADAALVGDCLRACPEFDQRGTSHSNDALSETQDAVDAAHALTSPPAPSMDMVPSRARRHRWPVVAVVMIGIAAVGWLLWPAPRDALPAGAWAAFLNAEFSTVTRMARSAQARGQSTEGLRLLHGLTLVVENRASATTVLEDAARASADSASRSAQLIRLAVGMTTREDASRAALETFIAAHPDEPTARILGCTYDLRAGEPHCERLEALLPGTAVAALVRGLHASRTARWRTARQIAQDALRHHPQTPALLLLEAESHVFLGDFERARTALTALLRREPGLMMARRRLLTALISLGLDADAARELARFEDDTTDPRHRLGMLYEAGRDHAGLGHAARAFAALDRATATARDLLDFGAVSSLCGQRFALARLLGDVARMEAALQCRRAAAGELEISNADRRKAQIANLVLHGELALHRHDLAEAKRTAGRLVGFEGEQAAVDAFRARLAAQEGDLKTADAALANGIDRCATHYNALSIWAQSGHRERALRAGKRLLNTECVMFGSDRIRVANAHLMLAELRAADAPQIALEHLAAWRTLWPSPDATLPAVHRAEAWVKRLTP